MANYAIITNIPVSERVVAALNAVEVNWFMVTKVHTNSMIGSIYAWQKKRTIGHQRC